MAKTVLQCGLITQTAGSQNWEDGLNSGLALFNSRLQETATVPPDGAVVPWWANRLYRDTANSKVYIAKQTASATATGQWDELVRAGDNIVAEIIQATQTLHGPDGTATAPGYRVGTSSLTGLFSAGDNSLGRTCNGTEIDRAYSDRLDLTIGRLRFPATQNASSNANDLDDYEEGSFTPTLTFGGASAGLTYSVNGGVYTKIGRAVYFTLFIALTNKGSSTGTAKVEGLPFTVSGNNYAHTLYLSNLTGGTDSLHFFVPDASATTLSLQFQPNSTGVITNFTDTSFTNTTNLILTGFYFV